MNRFGQFRQAYLDGCGETLRGLDAVLREGGVSARGLNSARRAIHSVKGGARAFGLEEVSVFADEFSHALERLGRREAPPDRREVAAMIHAGGALGALMGGTPLESATSVEFREILTQLGRGDIGLLEWPGWEKILPEPEPEPEPEPKPKAAPIPVPARPPKAPRTRKRVTLEEEGNDLLDSWNRVAKQVHGKVPVRNRIARDRGGEDER